MDAVDVHQHLLGEQLIAELARRRRPPALVRRREGWTFRVSGEPDSLLSFAATDAAARAEELRGDGVERALVALSTALGIETLPAEEAAPLLAAHHLDLAALPEDRFGGWGAVQLAEPGPAEIDAAIARGCAGIALPAAALATPGRLQWVGPLLERLEAHDAPLFVHPGPVATAADEGRGLGRFLHPIDAGGANAAEALPGWWPALTDYVAQMQAAWFAFLDAGRAAHPRLRVLFAMLAGGAPLQLERYAARAGEPPPAPDPLVYYDTSSYGPRMSGPMLEAVGAGQLVYGSDRPVVGDRPPSPDPDLDRAMKGANAHRLLTRNPKGDLG